MKSGLTCPTCGQLWPESRGKRACSACQGALRKRHRWFFGLDGRPQHWHCDDPTRGPGAQPAAEQGVFEARGEASNLLQNS